MRPTLPPRALVTKPRVDDPIDCIEAAIDRAPGLTAQRALHFPRLFPLDLAAYASFRCEAT